MRKNIVSFGISVLLIAIVVIILIRSNYITLVKKISWTDIAVSIVICLSVFALSGYRIGYLMSRQYHTRLRLIDVVTLPIMMNLWGYVIPKGGMLYSAFFLKTKYRIKAAEGFSIAVYIFLITMVLTGFIGLYYTVSKNLFFSVGTFISILLVLSPFIIKVLNIILQRFSFERIVLLKNIQSVTTSIIDNSNIFLTDVSMTVVVFLLTLANIAGRAVWFYWAATVFDMQVSIVAAVMLALVSQLALVIRFVPGNLGVNELMAGGALSILGGTIEEGILFTLFNRFACLLLTITVGLLSIAANMKYFHLKDLKSMWKALKSG